MRSRRSGPSYLVHLYEDDASLSSGLERKVSRTADRPDASATAKLFNDRYGMHRIYYHEAKDAFYFAAEAKAILAVRPELRSVDPRALGEFVSCGCVLENRTLFEGIQVLPPASTWVFRDGAIERKGNYFQPREWEDQDSARSRNPITSSCGKYFRGICRDISMRSEPIGMSLTGGLDTRMIMAWHKPPPGSLPCYSFGGMFRDCQDVIAGAQSGRRLRTVTRGDSGGRGVPLAVSPLCGTHGLPHRRLRRREPFT